MKRLRLIGLASVLACVTSIAQATNVVWQIEVPLFEVHDLTVAAAYATVEKLSQKLDPTGRGIRVVAYDYQSGLTNADLRHVSFKLEGGVRLFHVVRLLAEVTGHHADDVRLVGDVALLCNRQTQGQVNFHTAGLFGTIRDGRTGRPIRSATFKTKQAFSIERESIVRCAPDGSFETVIEYATRRPFCSGVSLVEPGDDTPQLVVTAPGYEEERLSVFFGDQPGTPNVDVKLMPRKAHSNFGPARAR